MSDVDRLAAAQAANPKRRLVLVDGPTGPIVLGNPKRTDYLQYRMLAQSELPADNARAQDELLLFCAVDPDRDAIKALLEEYPGLAGHVDVARGIRELVGVVTKK
jgi:hypothetical protein